MSLRLSVMCVLCVKSLALGQVNLIHAVEDLPTTASFYRALGLPSISTMPTPGALSPVLARLTGTKGAKFRALTFDVPGEDFSLELTEFTNLERAPTLPRMQDPGAPRLVLSVRDVDAAWAAAKKAGASALTVGGATVSFGSVARGIAFRDPDGFIVELVQFNPLPTTTAPAGANVIGGRLSITVGDLDKTIPFYRDVLGFEVKPATAFGPNENVMKFFDAIGGQWRYAMANGAGSSTNWEFAEFKDVARKPFTPRISDPGSPAISLVVRNPQAVVRNVKAAGGTVVSTGTEPVFLRDPDGVLLQLIEKN